MVKQNMKQRVNSPFYNNSLRISTLYSCIWYQISFLFIVYLLTTSVLSTYSLLDYCLLSAYLTTVYLAPTWVLSIFADNAQYTTVDGANDIPYGTSHNTWGISRQQRHDHNAAFLHVRLCHWQTGWTWLLGAAQRFWTVPLRREVWYLSFSSTSFKHKFQQYKPEHKFKQLQNSYSNNITFNILKKNHYLHFPHPVLAIAMHHSHAVAAVNPRNIKTWHHSHTVNPIIMTMQ